MIRCRAGEPRDIPWMLEELKAFSQFFGSKHSLFPSEAYGSEKLQWLIDNHVVIVAYTDINGINCVGFIIGTLIPHFFNPDVMVLTELFWWVTPDWRNTRTGLMLLNDFIAIGKAHADWVLMSLEEKSPVNPTTLERREFKLWERSYLLEV